MGYEICVFDAAFASNKEAAFDAWDQGTYFDASLLNYDRSAPKWRIKEALIAFNPQLTCDEPKEPATGAVAKLFGKSPSQIRYLNIKRHTEDGTTGFDVFDHAVEIILPEAPQKVQVQHIVRDMWRHLNQLSQLGFSTIYDTERDVLIDFETDFDAVVKGYLKNLEDDEDSDTSISTVALAANAPSPHAPQSTPSFEPRDALQPFTGNVGDSKPWWKFW